MAVLYHACRHLLLHSFTPIYIIGKAFSYMSYLVSGQGGGVSQQGSCDLCAQSAVSNFTTAYPRHDCPTIPEFEKRYTPFTRIVHCIMPPDHFLPFVLHTDHPSPHPPTSIMDEFGASFASLEDSYDPVTCVIHRESSTLKPFIAPIKAHLLQNPHIKYFQQLNPEWHKVPSTPTSHTQPTTLMCTVS